MAVTNALWTTPPTMTPPNATAMDASPGMEAAPMLMMALVDVNVSYCNISV